MSNSLALIRTLLKLILILAISIHPVAAFSAPKQENVSPNLASSAFKGSLQAKIIELIPIFHYRIVNTYPHDPTGFTQGLVFADNILYEGTGLRGRSSLRKVDLVTGSVLQIRKLPARFFGEGITVYGNRVIQLTWQARVGFVYDKRTFKLLDTFSYRGEGWGITHDGERLFMSDGTSTLRLLDPESYKESGRIEVYDANGPVSSLNELEYVQGQIYANVWRTDRIAIISPQSGEVVAWIELRELLSPEERNSRIDVLNGIAYDAKKDRLFVTGKLWPKLFEIELLSTNK